MVRECQVSPMIRKMSPKTAHQIEPSFWESPSPPAMTKQKIASRMHMGQIMVEGTGI